MHRSPVLLVPFLVAPLLLAGLAAPAGAQERPATDRADRTRPSVGAVRVDRPPVIDGRLDDEVWAAAPVATGFTQRQPDPGAAASQATEARIVYDDAAVYVAIRLHDDRPDLIAAPLARRDASGVNSDWVYVMLDSYHDRRTGFVFAVNPRGVRKDYMVYNDADEDVSWDPVWEVATTIDDLGWSAEFRIPLSQLRFDPDAETWGLNLQRRLARNEEWSFWSYWPPNAAGYVSHFGTLTDVRALAPARGIELQPYVSARLTRAPGDSADPFHSANDLGGAAGADLLVGLTSGLTLTATLNPDFGQVEADPAEVNLTAFESFFSERRPFFVERADVFRFGRLRSNIGIDSKEYFYSRRIGRAPQRGVTGGDIAFVDAPRQSPILGAAKLTGRTGDWTVGVLDAVTGRAEASYVLIDGERLTTPVEPLTNYFAGRARRDLRDGATVVGGMVTATNRAMSEEFEPILGRGAYFGGLDFEHRWGGGTWTASGFAAASSVHGDAAAIERLQRAPTRYYQRPDAGHLTLDPDRTSLAGHNAGVALQRNGDWDLSLRYEEISPGFEVNDLGFHGRVDRRSAAAFVGFRENETRGILRSHSAYTYGATGWNFDGDRHLTFFGGGANASFTNLWSAGIEGNIQPATLDDRLTRGGPTARSTTGWQLNGWVGTDPRRRLALEMNGRMQGNEEGGFTRGAGATAEWRPSAAVRLRTGPNVTRSRSARQYVTAVDDATADHTFGRRYVFAGIDQTVVSFTTRVDWTFSPGLSLEIYAQPFLAAGDYHGFRELAAPRTARFDVYGVDRGTVGEEDGVYTIDPDGAGDAPAFQVPDPSFNVRSLRGNAVLRWEYRPGSTLFFVWQQERSGFARTGDFDLGRDAGEILSAPGTNVFMIKATYWLGR